MGAYCVNTLHINTVESERTLERYPFGYSPQGEVRTAQFVLNNETEFANADEWHNLCKQLYKSILHSWASDSNFIRNATVTVIDWGNDIQGTSLAELRSFICMSRLKDWQIELLDKVKSKKETRKVLIFDKHGTTTFYIITEMPSTEVILQYSDIYVDFMIDHSNLDIDLLVFGESEIDNIMLNEDFITIDCEV